LFVSMLHECLAAEPGFPRVRIGMHHGDASNDGAPCEQALELSTFVASRARPGEVFATRAVASAAVSMGVEVVNLGDFELASISQTVTIFALDVAAAEGELVEDPVCRAEIERERAPARLRYKRVDYYFCSLECAGDFARGPTRFAFD
jgi:adenylate cyclase